MMPDKNEYLFYSPPGGTMEDWSHKIKKPTAIPVCCVTGRIAGDSFACGDCDPCGAAHTVPDVVKKLLKERDEFADKYEAAMSELDELRAGPPDDSALERS